jgi:hypothetical protein
MLYLMVHPEVEATGQVNDVAAFHMVYAPRGWRLLDPPTQFANDILEKFVRHLDDLDKDELRSLISTRGGEYPLEDDSIEDIRGMYLATFADPADTPVPTTAETSTGTVVPLFNPADHTVLEVREQLEQASDEEQMRILAAEEAGQARKGILEWTPANPAPAEEKE